MIYYYFFKVFAGNSSANHQTAALIGRLIPCDFRRDLISRLQFSCSTPQGMAGSAGLEVLRVIFTFDFIVYLSPPSSYVYIFLFPPASTPQRSPSFVCRLLLLLGGSNSTNKRELLASAIRSVNALC